MESHPAQRPRARTGGRLPFTLLCFCLCAIIVCAVVFVATHSLSKLVLSAGVAAGTPYPETRPCSLGALPSDTPATGGLVAALVSSAYQPPVSPTPVPHYHPQPPAPPESIALCVLRASDGALLARDSLAGTHLIPDEISALSITPDGGTIYLAGAKDTNPNTGRICALRPRPEAVLWCQDLDSYVGGPLVVGAATIYLVTFHAIYALDARSGAILWRDAVVLANDIEPPLHMDGGLLVGVTGDDIAADDRVCAWRATDGALSWCTNTFEDQSVRSVAAGDGFATVAVNFADGTALIEQLAERDGRVSWQYRVTASRVAEVADAGGIVYVVPDQCFNGGAACSGRALLLGAASGAPLGGFTVYGQVTAFAAVGSAAVFGTSAGIAATLDPLSTAPITWSYRSPRPGQLGIAASSGLNAVAYTSDAGIGLINLPTGVPQWEADSCGDRLAGSAASQEGTGAGPALIWCHWPPGAQMRQIAIQGSSP